MTKTGGGTLVLGRTNTYIGDTIVADGTLSIAADNRLGATSGALTLDGGFLRATESFTTSRATTLASTGGFDVESGDTLTHDGVISGTGSLTKTGDGTLILTGTNTYSGGTNVNGGTLSVGSDANLGAASGDITLNNGELQTTETFSTARDIVSNTGSISVDADTTLTVDGTISGSLLAAFGEGTLILNGANTVSDLNFGRGTLVLNDSQAAGSGTLNALGGTVRFGDGVDIGNTVTILAGSPSLDVASVGRATLSGNLVGGPGAPVEKIGTGTLVLSGDNIVGGGFQISEGTLSVSADENLGYSNADLVFSGGRLETTGTFSTARDFSISSLSRIDIAAGTTLTHDGLLRGSGDLFKSGAGTLVLDGANTHSGAVVVTQGTLALNHSEALGTGIVSFDFAPGGRIRYGDGVSIANELNVLQPGTLEVAGSDVAEQSGLIRTFAGEGEHGITKTGSGTLILSAANTYAGDTTINGGTLSVSSDGNLGDSGNGLVLSGGVLRSTADFTTERATTVTGTGGFDVAAGTTLTHEGLISGTGRLTLDGDGTLIVTSKLYGPDEPSYDPLAHSGGTTINSGTLQIGNRFNTSGSLGTGEVVNNGVLKLATGRRGTYANDISGTGTLVSSGNGSILLGNNSYGDTIIESSSFLQIGNEGTSGTLGTGTVHNSGVLVFERSDTHIVANDIVGETGFLWNRASGTTILLGTNEIESMAVIEGAIQIGNGGTSGTLGAGLSSINGELIFNRSGELTERTQLSGSGTIIQRGSGTVTLTGEGISFTGNTVVENGTLNVNNVLGGDLRTESGGTLGGSGTIEGNVTIEAGGTLAAGNSIGTLTVDSDLNLDAGSRLEIEVDPSGTTADLVAVGGRATLAGTAAHVGLAGDYAPSSSYTILTAAGGIDGTFGDVTSDFAFLDPRLTYGSNAVTLTLERNDIRFASTAHTANQAAAASGLEGLSFDNATYSAVTVLGEDDAAAAFDMLSGEVMASTTTSMVSGGQAINAFTSARARSITGPATPAVASFAPDPAFARGGPGDTPAWIRFLGTQSDIDGDGNAAGLDTRSAGTLVGLEGFALGSARLGVLAGYTRSNVDVGERASSADVDSYHLGVYGRTSVSGFALRGGVTASWHDIETDRTVVAGTMREDLSSDTNARSLQSFAEIAYGMPMESYAIEPYAALASVVVDSDGTTETGGSSALTSVDETTVTNFATVGARVGTTFDLGGMDATLRGGIGWRHAFGDVTPTTTNRIADGPDFTVSGTPITRNVALVELGVGLRTSANSSLHLSYDGEYGEGVRSHGAQLDFVFRF
ncbi:autotransporter domain-containing protein [Pontivivens ytuae]|uniref:Autotransporter domain-containing protein n=1 Tax=Pontivivens ytuae TaxID=2789856 RepID=A0A7S9QBW8_9RHOB|nr:autotransporter domain-containing protein [Pontivivens ytuae]QPH53318.1 autotransporter domain-containing protein [Pontivivens ytuae]